MISFHWTNRIIDCSYSFQVVEDGYEFFANRRLVTLFSAPNYCGQFDNAGAMMSVDDSLMCSFQVWHLSPEWGLTTNFLNACFYFLHFALCFKHSSVVSMSLLMCVHATSPPTVLIVTQHVWPRFYDLTKYMEAAASWNTPLPRESQSDCGGSIKIMYIKLKL